MKHLLTAALLFVTAFASAQIVNIPDPNFKNMLLEYQNGIIDSNADGEIEVSEAEAISSLWLDGDIYDVTGIKSFSNLDTLSFGNGGGASVQDLDLSGMASLRWLDLQAVFVHHSVNLSNCSNLVYLYLPFQDGTLNATDTLAVFDISNTPRLKELTVAGITLQELDLRQNDSLQNLHIREANIGVIDIGGNTRLENIFWDGGHIGLLNAENATGLKKIEIGNVIEILDSANLAGCSNLLDFNAYDYNGHELNLNDCKKLQHFVIQDAPNISSLDLHNCSNLQDGGGYFANLHFLNLKNGNPDQNLIIAGLILPGLYVCTDDFETADVLATLHLNNYSYNSAVVNSFCSPFPYGGDYNTIAGNIRLDKNNNGCDNADSLMPYIPVRITNNSLGSSTIRYSSSSAGHYQYYDSTGNFTVTPYFPYQYYSISPASSNIIFNSVNNLINSSDFCITTNGNHNQLDITIVPFGIARPGFTSRYGIYCRNLGTTTLSGNIQLAYDNNKMTVLSSGATSQSAGLLTWNYTNMQPFQVNVSEVMFNIPASPVNNIGDTLFLLAIANPVAGDETPANNSFMLPQKLKGSFDPNSKDCLEGEKLDITNIGQSLDYVIHFQNLGTDTAFNIVVTDTLSNNLDWESFDFTGSSHPCDVQRKGNKLQFYFKDIHLPYAVINEIASQGFVAFKIKPKNTVVIGDSLNNKASIYFDFNLPVVTNLATTIVSPVSTVPVKLEYFSLVNKNEGNQLIWKASPTTGITDFAIERSNNGIHFTNIGNITATMERCQSPFNFTDEKPFDGKNYYRINIKDANGISFYSKILVAERTRSGLSIITAIVSDQNNTTIYLNATKEQNIQMKVIAADGRLVYNQTKTIAAGSSTMNLSMKNLSNGIYTLIVYKNDGEVITKRFLK